MTGFSVDFLGCKISHTDAESIRDALLAAGHSDAADAKLHVLNTCCITAEAEKKSRKRARQLATDGGRVFVTGCGATLRPDSYSDLGDRVTALPGAAVSAIPAIVRSADQLADLGCKGAPSTGAGNRRTRAFVKIQDGCSFTCSYCIVPAVRGTSRSRSTDAILNDVRRRIAMGQREIVLTGVNIGLFRDPDSRISLPKLLHLVTDVPGVARVRISSIEVNHVTARLVDAMAAHPKVCPHLHIPLQSGDDGVLSSMRRNYRAVGYLKAVERARAAIPHLNLTADIIVGYPTEDDAAFANTLAVAREAGLTKVHAFPFSPRPGTDAEGANDPVPAATKKERSLALRTQAARTAQEFWSEKLGCADEVLVEQRADGTLCGYTRDYSPAVLEGDADDGELALVEITGVTAEGLRARVRK